uniref:Si:dkey-3d4.3 n=1 Tax=Acanthochromis polyacanthus TaxID=80966 RepID=A0A3Q1FFQ7_9TELE
MPVMNQSNPSLWTQLPQSSRSPCDRYKHVCCSYDGYVYILGGRESRCLRDFWKYSVGFLYVFGGLLDSAYTQCRCPLWVFDINRKGHSAVVIDSAMLMYGGFIDIKGSSQDFWRLDFTMAWSLLSGSEQD